MRQCHNNYEYKPHSPQAKKRGPTTCKNKRLQFRTDLRNAGIYTDIYNERTNCSTYYFHKFIYFTGSMDCSIDVYSKCQGMVEVFNASYILYHSDLWTDMWNDLYVNGFKAVWFALSIYYNDSRGLLHNSMGIPQLCN